MQERRTIVRYHAGMEGDPLELVEGPIHQAWDRAFTSICEVWPTPRAGFWHVWLRGPQSHATKEALPSDLVPALLQKWDFSAEEWRHWWTKPQPTSRGRLPPPAGPR